MPFPGLLLTGSPSTDQAGLALHPWGLDLQNSLQGGLIGYGGRMGLECLVQGLS